MNFIISIILFGSNDNVFYLFYFLFIRVTHLANVYNIQCTKIQYTSNNCIANLPRGPYINNIYIIINAHNKDGGIRVTGYGS